MPGTPVSGLCQCRALFRPVFLIGSGNLRFSLPWRLDRSHIYLDEVPIIDVERLAYLSGHCDFSVVY